MADAFTAKSWPFTRAPKRIELLGDKTKRPEPAQHIIEFPGGAIEVSRTASGDYWAHIVVNHGFADDDQDGMHAATGDVIDSRVFRPGSGLSEVGDHQRIQQIAVLIRPVRRPQEPKEPREPTLFADALP